MSIPAPLDTVRLAAVAAIFEAHEAFLLQAEHRRPGGGETSARTRPSFDEPPRSQSMRSSEGMIALQAHLKRHLAPSGHEDEMPPPLFRLVTALHDAHFVRLVPGGTPEDTIKQLRPADLLMEDPPRGAPTPE